jgi:hypothetical protein
MDNSQYIAELVADYLSACAESRANDRNVNYDNRGLADRIKYLRQKLERLGVDVSNLG